MQLKIVQEHGQQRCSSQTLSFGNLFLRNPCYNYSTNISTYFLNFYLSLSFFDSMYWVSLPSFICFSVSLARQFRASFIIFQLYSSQILRRPNYFKLVSVILCSLRQPKRQCSTFLVEIAECLKTFQRRAAASQQSLISC